MTPSPRRLILGSASPRRRELLLQIGIVPSEIRPPDVDETPLAGELPRAYCRRVTVSKIASIDAADDEVALCADTTVALGRRILGKPQDRDEARAFLETLSGRRHRVITAVAIKNSQRLWVKEVVSTVRMKRLSTDEIDGYLTTDDWKGKAGAYAIQGPAAAFIPWISGSHSAIVGLPLAETATLLAAAGFTTSRVPA